MEGLIHQESLVTREQIIPEVKQEKKSIKPSLISFSESYDSFCVGIVDIVNSTQITARLTKDKACKYYEIFLNSMADIAFRHGATIVKNIGDSLLFYFPVKGKELSKFISQIVLKCGMDMLESRNDVNILMQSKDLPRVNYRVSFDYGEIMIACELSTQRIDIFGTPVNMCSKINHFAKPNEMVIGGDLYEITKSAEYTYKEVKACSAGFKFPYPIYVVHGVTKPL